MVGKHGILVSGFDDWQSGAFNHHWPQRYCSLRLLDKNCGGECAVNRS